VTGFRTARSVRRWLDSLRPPPKIDICAWIEKHARLYNGGRIRLYEYQKEIARAMVDPKVTMVTWRKAARVGFTQLVSAMLAYWAAHDQGNNVMVVQPTVEDGEDYSKDVVEPMLGWPVMALCSDQGAKKSGDTIKRKAWTTGGSLKIAGANSPRAFRRIDLDKVVFDEVDGYPHSAGKEGDQISLGIQRLTQSVSPLAVLASTPLIAGHSRIESRYLEGTQESWHVPCPHCGEFQRLEWNPEGNGPGVKWDAADPIGSAYYLCVSGCVIEERHKASMVAKGRYVAANPDALKKGHRSFDVSQLYLTLDGASWGKLASRYEEVKDRPGELQVFTNTVLGETFRVKGLAPEWQLLYDRRDDYRPGIVPSPACLVTMGIDVQKDRIEAYTWAWGRGRECWLIDYQIFQGSPFDKTTADSPWPPLREYVNRTWEHENGTHLKPLRVAIDTGFATTEVAAFVRGFSPSFMLPVKGASSAAAPVMSNPRAMDLTDTKGRKRRALKVWVVGDHVLKQELFGLLALPKPTDEALKAGGTYPAGYIHLGKNVASEEVCRQLVGEEWDQANGRWRDTYAHEALDCWKYARASLDAAGVERWTDAKWREAEAAVGIHREAPARRPKAQDNVTVTSDVNGMTGVTAQAAPRRTAASSPGPADDWLNGGGRRRRGW